MCIKCQERSSQFHKQIAFQRDLVASVAY